MSAKHLSNGFVLVLIVIIGLLIIPLPASGNTETASIDKIEKKIAELQAEGKIPGVSIVIVNGTETILAKGFGYADVEKQVPVRETTGFELASCSKAFTALAACYLEEQGLLNLDDPVSKYIPGFKGNFGGRSYDITLRQALHQTSGIPSTTISRIPSGTSDDMLAQTVQILSGIQLDSIPGKRYQYATINYDIVGRVIEIVSKMRYEDFMVQKILIPLGMTETVAGAINLPKDMAQGYKIGFREPKRYDPPIYRGNTPAGYIISNANDMAKWLKIQMGAVESPLNSAIARTHQRDLTVPIDLISQSSYAMGWEISLSGNGYISHSGWNPSFTSHVSFNPDKKIGVVVMANSNSDAASGVGGAVYLGKWMMDELTGNEHGAPYNYSNGIDGSSSVIALIMLGLIICDILFLLSVIYDIIKGRRAWESLSLKKIGKIAGAPILIMPFLYAIYLVPKALMNGSWEFIQVWGPDSIQTLIMYSIWGGGLIYVGYVFSLLFPHKNPYLRNAPLLIILSLLNGGANAVVIFLITSSLYTVTPLMYILYFFGLAMVVYIAGRRFMQIKMMQITLDIVYDLRIKLIRKIFFTSFQKFEKIEGGRVFATLNNDTSQIGGSAAVFVGLISNIITAIGCFIYLATVAFWATAVTLGVIIMIAGLYYYVSKKAEFYMEDARDTQNVYMALLQGLTNGFKELSLHLRKKREYREDIEASCDRFRSSSFVAMVKLINAFLIGESMLIMILGAVGFAIPRLFPDISKMTLMSFIMILLYLIGPINGILGSIPQLIQLRVSWRRVQGFMREIPANIDPKEIEALGEEKKTDIESLEAKGVMFKYETKNAEEEGFAVGPIDFEAKKGEIIFIVGGNGSGKTTLAKLLTGLYIPDSGSILINGKEISNYELSEYYSAVFSGFHLFRKMYNVDLELPGKLDEANDYLKMLHMDQKIEIKDKQFTSINVSGGQRKRLALLQCYLEDCPIFLFDELAADQDPGFRKFFYRDLLIRMKQKGKIVIAVTHDDHYFDVADRVIKMDMGKIDRLDINEFHKVTG